MISCNSQTQMCIKSNVLPFFKYNPYITFIYLISDNKKLKTFINMEVQCQEWNCFVIFIFKSNYLEKNNFLLATTYCNFIVNMKVQCQEWNYFVILIFKSNYLEKKKRSLATTYCNFIDNKYLKTRLMS